MQAKYNKNKGFSILEIAIVLVIIAVFASTTLPKIRGSLKSDTVSIASVAGEFDNTVRQARAQWFANGQSGTGRIEGFGDGLVWSGDRGWPVGHNGATPPKNLTANACADVWNGIMRDKKSPRVTIEDDAPWQAQSDGQATCRYVAQLGQNQRVINYNTRSGKVSYQ
ncbi:MAG: pilus assembly FimT family protein [Granulosicoccaceae bacterium]